MSRAKNIAFLSTYPPRECGIATFTQDLVQALMPLPGVTLQILAINDRDYSYPQEVVYTLSQQQRGDYAAAAAFLSEMGADLLMVEHEYGIFGGHCGDYLLDLVERAPCPVVSTLHTVLPNPLAQQELVLKRLCRASSKVILMAQNAADLLAQRYEVPEDKLAVVHHGVPRIDVPSREDIKRQEGYADRLVISTFGLLSAGKGLEVAIEAIARVADAHPEVLYLILGQTHPVVKAREGEAYRYSLEKLVKQHRLEHNVRFVNRYLTKEEIVWYLQLSDLYLTPYLGREQAVSGTLAYAVGYGRIILSTPYPYAREMLADGRGLLAGFGDADGLADNILRLAGDPALRAQMEQRVLELGRTMAWDQVAARTEALFEELMI